jgi:putative nucleotidyltransferase with HDIG domain
MEQNIFKDLQIILLNEKKPSLQLEKAIETKQFKDSKFNIIRKLIDIPQEKKFHPEGNVWNHTKMVVDIGAIVREFSDEPITFMWSTLLHDIGKIPTTKFIRGRYRSYDHDKEGSKMAYDLISYYRDTKLAQDVKTLVRYHMHHIYISKNLPFSDMKGLVDSNKINDIILLFISDKLGRGNQTKEEYKKSIEEVFVILGKIEKYSHIKYDDLKDKVREIEKIIII